MVLQNPTTLVMGVSDEIMQSLKKAIDLKVPEEGIYLGNDEFFKKKKIDFLKEIENDN